MESNKKLQNDCDVATFFRDDEQAKQETSLMQLASKSHTWASRIQEHY
jgi:hypothetical protein